MKLVETHAKPMKDILNECDVIDQKIHTDEDGNIKSIEVKYRPKDAVKEGNELKIPEFGK